MGYNMSNPYAEESIAADEALVPLTSRDFRDEEEWPRVKVYPARPYGYPLNKQRGRSRGERSWRSITAIMLHTTDCNGIKPDRGLGIPAHGVVANDATVVLCHYLFKLVYHGHAANRFSVGLEIAGLDGACTPEQAAAAIAFVRSAVAGIRYQQWEEVKGVVEKMPTLSMMAHRNSHIQKPKDPDYTIWRDVALPCMDQFGLIPFVGKVGSGRPLPINPGSMRW